MLFHNQNQQSGDVYSWHIENGAYVDASYFASPDPTLWKVVGRQSGLYLHTSTVVNPAPDMTNLTQSELHLIVNEALARWTHAGLDASMLERFASVNFVIVDLPGSCLGEAVGRCIYIDINAAGHGWFVDATPDADEEYAADDGSQLLQAIDPRAVDRIDLLTVVEHELGHIAGYDDLDSLADSIMSGLLETGIRRNPQIAGLDAILAVGV